MVADDDEFCLSYMKSMFGRTSLNMNQIDFCIDGKDAIDMVKKTYAAGESYKFIILDFSMP